MLRLSEVSKEDIMLKRLLGTKVGMTQVFDENRNVIPVTVIDVGDWFVIQVKTTENDGYAALQLGLLRKRYKGKSFSGEWLKAKEKFFGHIKEVHVDGQEATKFAVGQKLSVKDSSIAEQDSVNVAGISRGLGFQGVVKRWGFSGGPGGHGSTFHRIPGSVGNMCSQGNVIKGKKLPGHCGCSRTTVKNLVVVKVDSAANYLFIKGAVPGKRDALLFISKQG